MEEARKQIESLDSEELKKKLLEKCDSKDFRIQNALIILFPKNGLVPPIQRKFPPPPPAMMIKKKEKAYRRRSQGMSHAINPLQDRIRATDTKARGNRGLTIDQESGITLKYILQEPTLCQGFRKYLEKQFCEENLLFHQKASRYRQIAFSMEPEKQFKVAKQIFDMFVSQSAPKQVNLNSACRVYIQQSLEEWQENTSLPSDLFDVAIGEAEYILATDCYPRFLKSPQLTESKEIIRQIRCLSASVREDNKHEKTGLSARQWKILTSDAKLNHYTSGAVILKEGDHSRCLYRLKRGRIELCITREDKKMCLGMISEPGSVIGELCVVGQVRSVATVISQDPNTEIHLIDITQFLSLLQSDNELAFSYFKQLGKKLATLLYNQTIEGVEVNEKDCESSSWLAQQNERNYRDDDLFVYMRNNFPEIPSNEVPVKQTKGMKSQSRNVSILVTQNYLCLTGGSIRVTGGGSKDIFLLSQLTVSQKQKSNTLSLRFAHKKVTIKTNTESEFEALKEVIKNRQTVSHSVDKTNSLKGYSFWFSMSSEEWDKILNINGTEPARSAPCILHFDSGDVVVRSGQQHCMLGQILKGSCSVTSKHSNSPSAWLGCGDLLGEVEFLADCSSLNTIVASENGTSICVIDRKYIKEELSTTNILLAAKFYRQMCQALGIRFRNS